MNAIKNLTIASLIVASAALAGTAAAQAMDHSKMQGTAVSASAADLTDGEIKKIDKDNKKLTIKHGDIKNLDMPGMTMVFQVKDPAMLDQVKMGDKVRFTAERQGGAIVVTRIEAAK